MSLKNHQTPSDFRSRLVCPICKGKLDFMPEKILCTSCQASFPQMIPGLYDLMPGHLLVHEESEWHLRQQEMLAWYEDLLDNPSKAISCFNKDFEPYKPLLSNLTGSILDIGGGNGIVRHFLPATTDYVAIDPSLEWVQSDWQDVANYFSNLQKEFRFVRGLGEYLPFPASSFDHVLSFWSLNHTIQPERVFQEVHTILCPGGRFIIVLEDTEPDWRDVPVLLPQIHKMKRRSKLIISKIQSTLHLNDWVLQKDHIRIRETDIASWCSIGYTIAQRKWIGGYLTFELRRI